MLKSTAHPQVMLHTRFLLHFYATLIQDTWRNTKVNPGVSDVTTDELKAGRGWNKTSEALSAAASRSPVRVSVNSPLWAMCRWNEPKEAKWWFQSALSWQVADITTRDQISFKPLPANVFSIPHRGSAEFGHQGDSLLSTSVGVVLSVLRNGRRHTCNTQKLPG